ncbi:hypothetical protein [Intestinibacter bartlettii]|uniref:Uncharacterized protein n=1 Tax=Intestinibacter bartlettii TaxID=261299 RepID=A0ABS6DWP2_9FIRM|nr:hypothetical protein [Intestinibacter bartlettii]MBU5336155.1 hypothetical protein [Intestinibacter bartlettii]
MGFKDELFHLKNVVMSLQENKEKIDEEDVVSALVILNYIQYNSVADAFLGCAAINLINTYVKQKDSKLNYKFRRHISNVLKGIEDINKNEIIKVYFEGEKKLGMLMIVFWDFQFSFQHEKETEIIRRLQSKKDAKWDGIRKQLCAKTIFDFSLNTKSISNMTQNKQDLKSFIQKEVEIYREGGYKFINGQLIKIRDIKYGKDVDDKKYKNYFREELRKCQGRPVMLTGKFKCVWKKHVTFTTIRPYIQNCKTITICNHINLYKPDVEKVYDIDKLEKNRKYYIIGFCEEYRTQDRIGIKLAIGFEFKPLIKASDLEQNILEDISSICYRFSIEEFLRESQKYLIL